MNLDRQPTPDTTPSQNALDSEAQRDLERCMRMISPGSPEEIRWERRAAWRNISTEEKLWQIGLFFVFGLSVCGIDVVCDFFHLPSICFIILLSIVGLTLLYSKFRSS